MPIFSRSDKKSPSIKSSEDPDKLRTLTVTQTDTKYGKLEYNKNLKTVIFDSCSSVKYEVLSKLFRANPKIAKVVFINCKKFGENAFEAFRSLDKSLANLDLTGYPVSNDELKSLIRSDFKNLILVIFGNTCDVTKKFKEEYPNCKIVGMDTKYVSNSRGYIEYTRFGDKDNRMPSLQENQERMRRHESRPRSTSHRDDMVDDDNDYDNYRGKHLHCCSASRMAKNDSDKRLNPSLSKSELRVHRSRNYGSSSDDDKHGAQIRSMSSSETSSDDSDTGTDSDSDFKRSSAKKNYEKYERRK